MRLLNILIFLLALSSTSAAAQTACPVGVTAGSAQCGPDLNSNSDAGSYEEPPARIVYVPTGEWRNGYGAIAIDSELGPVGTAIRKASEFDADAAAIAACKKGGGVNCVVFSQFLNRCVAVAGPVGSAGQITASTDVNHVEVAKKNAVKLCERDNGKQCAVEWSDCSKSEYYRY